MATRKNRNKARRRQARPQPVSSKPLKTETRAGASANRKPSSATVGAGLRSFFSPSGLANAPSRAHATVALCLLVAFSYFPALGMGFVWDDFAWNEAAQVLSPSGIWQIWFAPHTLQNEGHYWPLLYTTFWLEHKLWGLAPAGYHFVNLLLHTATVLLLWRLLRRLAVPGAWFAAAVFAVHPLHVESVAWVIGRKDVLAGLFSVACVLYYLRFVEDGRRAHYIRALAAFAAGLLCKSIVITLPVSLLLWHWWKQGRVVVADVVRTLPLLLAGLAITVTDWWYYKNREVIVLEDYALIEQALSAARALWFYAGKLLWPADLAVIYPRWIVSIGEPLDWAYLVAAVAVVAALWCCRARIGRGPLAGVLFFVITLSPTLGFVEYGFMQFSLVADRYQYLAGAGVTTGVIAALATVAARIAGRWPDAPQRAMYVMAALLLAVLGTITWNQTGIYRDNFTFYNHIISLNPQARNAWYNLGREHQADDRLEEALAAYRTAGEQRPGHTWAHIGAGMAATDLGRLAEAETHFQRALAAEPDFPEALNGLGALRLRQKRYREALELFQTLIKLEPEYAKVYSGIGVALAGLNRHAEALRSFDRALELDPNLEEARTNREHVRKDLQSGSK